MIAFLTSSQTISCQSSEIMLRLWVKTYQVHTNELNNSLRKWGLCIPEQSQLYCLGRNHLHHLQRDDGIMKDDEMSRVLMQGVMHAQILKAS
jgi:hypothetical protein